MSNINGKVYAMNAITPMKPWKTWILRAIFFVLGHVKPLQKDLIDLSFIEFARWVVVPRGDLPFLGDGQAQEDLRYRSEEHTSELQSLRHLVCRLLLEK